MLYPFGLNRSKTRVLHKLISKLRLRMSVLNLTNYVMANINKKSLSPRFFRHYIHSGKNTKVTKLTVLLGIGYNDLENKGVCMARFIGTIKDYEKYIGPRIRNIVNTLAKKEREKRQGICEFCNEKAELQSAHKHGKGRKDIIYEALKKYNNGSYIDMDIEECENYIVELHKPINQVFYFLCFECHRKYDSSQNGTEILKSNRQEDTYSFEKKTEGENAQDIVRDEHLINIENGGQLVLLPNKEIFTKNLLRTKKAKWKIIYADGSEKEGIWNANNFTKNSDVINIIRSGKLRGWKNKKIVKAIYEV